MSSAVRVLGAALLSAVAMSVIGGSAPAATTDEARAAWCRPYVKYRGSVYVSYSALARYVDGPVGRPGRAIRPGCNDVAGPPTEPDRPVAVYRIRNVHPAIAVMGGTDSLYVAWGFFIELPSHPLHRAFERATRRYPPPARRRCSRAFELRGRVDEPPHVQSMTLSVGRGPSWARRDPEVSTHVGVDARTQVLGLRRLGLPFVRLSQSLVVKAVRCRYTGGEPFVIARTIAAPQR